MKRPKRSKIKRKVYHTVPHKGGWAIKHHSGRVVAIFLLQAECELSARVRAREDWTNFGQPSQVVFHKRNGKIRQERTYGLDPRRFKS